MKLSERIELVISIFEACKSDNDWYEQQQTKSEFEITNLNHELEGVGEENRSPPGRGERTKIAAKLQKALMQRRVAKDAIRAGQPVLKFMESDIGQKALNQLRQTLGELRRVERSMSERKYAPRTLARAPGNPEMERNLEKLIREWKQRRRQ